jgi:hypothetical protein
MKSDKKAFKKQCKSEYYSFRQFEIIQSLFQLTISAPEITKNLSEVTIFNMKSRKIGAKTLMEIYMSRPYEILQNIFTRVLFKNVEIRQKDFFGK